MHMPSPPQEEPFGDIAIAPTALLAGGRGTPGSVAPPAP